MFQAAFWAVMGTKLVAGMPDSCRQLSIWYNYRAITLGGREMFPPVRKIRHLMALWRSNWMFVSLLSALFNFLLQILYKAAWKPWCPEQIPGRTEQKTCRALPRLQEMPVEGEVFVRMLVLATKDFMGKTHNQLSTEYILCHNKAALELGHYQITAIYHVAPHHLSYVHSSCAK